MTPPRVRVLLVLAALLLGAVPGVASASAGPAPAAVTTTASTAGAACPDVFPAAFAARLRRDFPGQRVTAHVRDTRTGCEDALDGSLRLTTASVVKAAVLGAVLLQAQDAGRDLTDGERGRIRPMIQLSHDNPHVSYLYRRVGGVAGMDRSDRRFGATSTTNTAAYGATRTTARDRTRISVAMLHGGGPLAAPARAQAWRYLSTVHPTQRWGISAGVPGGWSVALKNGFYPMRGAGWRVGSTGFVRQGPAGSGGYGLTVLTDGGTSAEQGVRLVEAVAQRVAAVLAGGPAVPRSVDRAVCTTARGGESWAAVARRVGAAPAAVRHVSGGNAAPLRGQRACAPHLRG